MIRAEITLIRGGAGTPESLHVLTIANDGTGNEETGNYNVTFDGQEIYRIQGYPREFGAAELVRWALGQAQMWIMDNK